MTAIARLLAERGASQKELAAAVGVSEPTVSDWVNGKKTPRGSNAGKIAAFFGIDASTLVQMIAQGDDADGTPSVRVLSDADIDAIAKRVQTQAAPAEPSSSPVIAALYGDVHDLTDDEAADVRDYIQFLKSKRK